MNQETRLRMALELTRMVWDLKDRGSSKAAKPSDQLLDVFAACFRRLEELSGEATPPVIPRD